MRFSSLILAHISDVVKIKLFHPGTAKEFERKLLFRSFKCDLRAWLEFRPLFFSRPPMNLVVQTFKHPIRVFFACASCPEF